MVGDTLKQLYIEYCNLQNFNGVHFIEYLHHCITLKESTCDISCRAILEISDACRSHGFGRPDATK